MYTDVHLVVAREICAHQTGTTLRTKSEEVFDFVILAL